MSLAFNSAVASSHSKHYRVPSLRQVAQVLANELIFRPFPLPVIADLTNRRSTVIAELYPRLQ